jgi:hypothetical protein
MSATGRSNVITKNNRVGFLLASLFAGSLLLTQSALAAGSEKTATAGGDDTVARPAESGKSLQKFSGSRSSLFFKRNWGIDIVGVHPVSSGQMLAFRYRVLDDVKAKPLFDKTHKPYLIDEATGTRLAVPAMENVGELRQDVTPAIDRIYYTIFGNPGKLVKAGSRVSIVIGDFHIDGLIVD